MTFPAKPQDSACQASYTVRRTVPNAPVTVRVEEHVSPRGCRPPWGILTPPHLQESSCSATSRMHWLYVPNVVVGCPAIGDGPVGRSGFCWCWLDWSARWGCCERGVPSGGGFWCVKPVDATSSWHRSPWPVFRRGGLVAVCLPNLTLRCVWNWAGVRGGPAAFSRLPQGCLKIR